MIGEAKLFDPRAEFVTAWPLEGHLQCDLCNDYSAMLPVYVMAGTPCSRNNACLQLGAAIVDTLVL